MFEQSIAQRMGLLHTESAFQILAQANALEAQGRTLMDYVRETYNYRPDRVARALDALDGEEG